MQKKIAIFCGGPSSEHEVSLKSAQTIYKYIDKNKYELYFFYISKKNNCSLLFASPTTNLKKIKPIIPLVDGLDSLRSKKIFAFLAGIHGEFVEDGRLQGLLEFYKIPYSGTGVSASSLAMDKYRSSLLVNTIKDLHLPKTFLLSNSLIFPEKLDFPVIIKPNTMGSSVGVSIAKNGKEFDKQIKSLRVKYPLQEIIVQEYLSGAIEIQCGTLQTKAGKFLSVPPIEIIPKKNVFFDYDSKYLKGGAKEITPPISISKKMSDKITNISKEIHILLGLKTYSRNDFLVKDNRLYFLESNALPGMTATSLLPQEAQSMGIDFPELLDFVMDNSNA